MSVYADRMKRHLAHYKRERLGVAEDGVWRRNGRAYGHILPESLRQLNLIETVRREFWRYHAERGATLGLHTDFHHLNSSQAFAFNLLFPWMTAEDTVVALLGALGRPGRAVRSWEFEYVPHPDERTSVDFSAELADGSRVLVEVKLTESHFGRCVPRDVHLAKLKDTYTPRLAERVPAASLDPAVFFPNYQLFRNVSTLDLARGDTLVLLLPRANALTWEEGERFLAQHVLSPARERITMIAAEDLVAALTRSASSPQPRLQAHVELLTEKYLPDGAG